MNIKHPFWHPSESKGFIIDWDGVIADTRLDFSGIRRKFFNGEPVRLLEEAEKLPAEKKIELLTAIEEEEIRGASQAVLIPGVTELIEWLESNHKKWCIVSRNCERGIRTGAEAMKITLPELLLHRDNTEYCKPDPRAFDEAAARMGLTSQECTAIGDFIYDIECARRAGARAVLVQNSRPEWSCWTDLSCDTLKDFVAELKSRKPLVPWEYRETAREKGLTFLKKAGEISIALPKAPEPELAAYICEAARLGIRAIYTGKSAFTPQDWKQSPSMPPEAMGESLTEAVRLFTYRRYPMLEIKKQPDKNEKITEAPAEADRLSDFIERHL